MIVRLCIDTIFLPLLINNQRMSNRVMIHENTDPAVAIILRSSSHGRRPGERRRIWIFSLCVEQKEIICVCVEGNKH